MRDSRTSPTRSTVTGHADKRRSVEIALREFPKLSSRALAKMCGVDHKTVEAVRPRPPTGEFPQLGRTGLDGKERPASRRMVSEGAQEQAPDEPAIQRRELGPPSEP